MQGVYMTNLLNEENHALHSCFGGSDRLIFSDFKQITNPEHARTLEASTRMNAADVLIKVLSSSGTSSSFKVCLNFTHQRDEGQVSRMPKHERHVHVVQFMNCCCTMVAHWFNVKECKMNGSATTKDSSDKYTKRDSLWNNIRDNIQAMRGGERKGERRTSMKSEVESKRAERIRQNR